MPELSKQCAPQRNAHRLQNFSYQVYFVPKTKSNSKYFLDISVRSFRPKHTGTVGIVLFSADSEGVEKASSPPPPPPILND